MTPYNEREVLKLLQEESTQRKGFELIVAQYSEQLYWQIRRMVLSHEDANDLLQNTFIKAWTNIDYFRDLRDFGRSPESLLSPCREENREVFGRSRLNLLKQTLSNQKRGEKRMKEEDTLLKKIGKEHSFKVPDGYFENLTSEVMNKLPEKEKVVFKEEPVSTWTRLKPLFYMAAMFVGAALIIRVASSDHKPAADDITVAVTAMETDTEQVSDEMIDVALDRAMLDDYSLYVYLSDASVE